MQSMFDAELFAMAIGVLDLAKKQGVMIATAESCTGGLVAGVLTEVAGSSAVFERGFVTYSNEAKNELIGVPMDLIIAHGAVSEAVASAMALGAIAHSRAQLSVAITGIAGPGGGSALKPVGLVHFASARNGEVETRERRFGDLGRAGIRRAAMVTALDMLTARLS